MLTHTGTGGAVRGGMTGGGTNRNTPRVRVRARVPRARALAFPSEATTIFHSVPVGRVRVYGFAKLSIPPTPPTTTRLPL